MFGTPLAPIGHTLAEVMPIGSQTGDNCPPMEQVYCMDRLLVSTEDHFKSHSQNTMPLSSNSNVNQNVHPMPIGPNVGFNTVPLHCHCNVNTPVYRSIQCQSEFDPPLSSRNKYHIWIINTGRSLIGKASPRIGTGNVDPATKTGDQLVTNLGTRLLWGPTEVS